jgi:dGTP triphosphohydrolase
MDDLRNFHGALSHLAFDIKKSRGRLGCSCEKASLYDDDDFLKGYLNPFRVDTVKIQNSKAFRRAAGKTQVFPIPNNPHIRTRQLHSAK